MIVEIVDMALPKKMNKLLTNLVKTANKFSGFNIRKSQIAISFVDKNEIKRLNKEFRNKDQETDVLSFPVLSLTPGQKVKYKDFLEDVDPDTRHIMLGDIIICEDVAREHAKEYNHSFEREVCYLVVHGTLHLLGFDHEKEEDKMIMRCYEESVLRKYHITRDF